MLNRYLLVGLFGVLATMLVSIGLYATTYTGNNLEQRLVNDYGTQEMTVSRSLAGSIKSQVAILSGVLSALALNESVSNPDPAVCNEALDRAYRQPDINAGNLGRVDANGIFYCSVNRKIIGTPAEKLGDYVPKLLNDPLHHMVMSRAITVPGAEGYLSAIHIPVYTKSNQFAGTLGGALYFNNLSKDILDKIKFLAHGTTFMQDDNGDILYSATNSYIGKNYFSPTFQDDKGLSNLNSAIREAYKGTDTTVRYSFKNTERMASVTSVEVVPGHRWIIGVTAPVSDIKDVFTKSGLQRAFLVITVIIALLVIILTILLLIVVFLFRRHSLNLIVQKRLVEFQKERAESLLSSIGDGVVAIDANWRITLINPAALKLIGTSKSEVIGQDLKSSVPFIRGHDRQPYFEFIEHAMNENKTFHITEKVLLQRQDGAELPIGDSAAPLTDDKGIVSGAIIVFRDLTQEIEQSKLKSEFAYASHQLLTPVSQISASLATALTEKSLSAVREDIRYAQIATESIKRMSSHLVSVSEIEQGNISATSVRLDVMAVIYEAIKELEAEAKRYKATIKIESGNRKTLSMNSDPEKFRKIILELLDNAILYSAPKQIITIRVAQLDNQLAIEVQNIGPIISEEEQPQIFSKFFRGSNKAMEAPGAGLGLYLTRNYVNVLLGKLWFISAADKTTFFVTLPMNEPPSHLQG